MNNQGQRHGWGRMLRHDSRIGWWVEGKCQGNCYGVDEEGEIVEEETGWKEADQKTGEFQEDSEQYKFFKAEDFCYNGHL